MKTGTTSKATGPRAAVGHRVGVRPERRGARAADKDVGDSSTSISGDPVEPAWLRPAPRLRRGRHPPDASRGFDACAQLLLHRRAFTTGRCSHPDGGCAHRPPHRQFAQVHLAFAGEAFGQGDPSPISSALGSSISPARTRVGERRRRVGRGGGPSLEDAQLLRRIWQLISGPLDLDQRRLGHLAQAGITRGQGV